MADLQDDFTTMIFTPGRTSIASIFPDVSIEEVHEDRLQITSHPVENGATVSDHAFLLPKTCDLRIGWSDSKQQSSGNSREQYEALLQLQAQREPFDVSTGKRVYRNMLVAGITVTNDVRTPQAVLATVRLQEVRITSATQQSSAPQQEQSNPASTQGPVQEGTVNPTRALPYGSTSPSAPPLPLDRTLQIPLQAQPGEFLVPLNGVDYTMQTFYADVASGGGWFLNLIGIDGVPILTGIPMIPGVDLLEPYQYLNLGHLYVYSDTGDAPGFADLGVSSHLVYSVVTNNG